MYKVNFIHKFVLLMWKNWVLVKRHKIQTIVEILSPVLVFSIINLVRIYTTTEVFLKPFDYDEMPLINKEINL